MTLATPHRITNVFIPRIALYLIRNPSYKLRAACALSLAPLLTSACHFWYARNVHAYSSFVTYPFMPVPVFDAFIEYIHSHSSSQYKRHYSSYHSFTSSCLSKKALTQQTLLSKLRAARPCFIPRVTLHFILTLLVFS